MSLGGLGIPSTTLIAPSAFLSSSTGSRRLVESILNYSYEDPLIGYACDTWQSQVEYSEDLPTANAQKLWTKPVFNHVYGKLLNSFSKFDCKRLKCYTGKFQSSWLNALPSVPLGLKLSNEQLRISLATRLGSKVCEPHVCKCGAQVDERGLHGLSCKRSSARHSRHTELNNFVKRTLSAAGFVSVLKPPGLARTDGKRPDGMTLIP